MACKKCEEQEKTWKGDDPQCAFNGGVFSTDNWMCATANRIRDIVSDWNDKFPPTVDFRFHMDQRYASICLGDIFLPTDDVEPPERPIALWVTWYKSRGRTDAMWLLYEYENPRQPTEEECLEIIEYHKTLSARQRDT